MKKVNWGYVLKTWGAVLAIEVAIILLGFAAVTAISDTGISSIILLALFITAIFVPISTPDLLRKKMVKCAARLEERFVQENFICNHQFTSNNGIYYVDVAGGRLAAICKYNPKELQFMDASKFNAIATNDGRRLFGTNLVSCQFMVEGTKIRIYTLRVSGRALSMKAPEVLEAISKADTLCEQLSAAKQAALARR